MTDRHGNALDPTYLKRARQLVKQSRAEWVSENAIRLTHHNREESTMNSNHMNGEQTGAGSSYRVMDERREYAPMSARYDDEAVLELARRRVAAKKNLWVQTMDMCLLIIMFIMILASYHESMEMQFTVMGLFGAFWGMRLIVRWVRYIRPSVRGGFAAYWRTRRERNIEAEYVRLRNLSGAEVAREMTELRAVDAE